MLPKRAGACESVIATLKSAAQLKVEGVSTRGRYVTEVTTSMPVTSVDSDPPMNGWRSDDSIRTTGPI